MHLSKLFLSFLFNKYSWKYVTIFPISSKYSTQILTLTLVHGCFAKARLGSPIGLTARFGRDINNHWLPTRVVYFFNPTYHSNQVWTHSQWFLNLLSNQALAPQLTGKAWFDFQLGLFVLVLIRMTSYIQLWAYRTDWLTWQINPFYSFILFCAFGSDLYSKLESYFNKSNFWIQYIQIFTAAPIVLFWNLYRYWRSRLPNIFSYVHICLKLTLMIKSRTKNLCRQSEIPEVSVKPYLACQSDIIKKGKYYDKNCWCVENILIKDLFDILLLTCCFYPPVPIAEWLLGIRSCTERVWVW